MKRHVESISFRVWDNKGHEPIWYSAVLEEWGGIYNWRLTDPRGWRYRSDWLDRYCASCDLYFTSYRNGDQCPCCGDSKDVRRADIENEFFNGDAPF